ncbi:MAG TPA: sigma-70 family RNA polymerase sigma factor [Acidimicrobiia bacterium]|nr:sigma-70 family RNA polymerase sigma factor [Acidimicrobiia bacterium]
MDQPKQPMVEAANVMLADLFRSHHAQLLAYCARRIGRDEAEDAAAEVFAIATRRQAEITSETALAWLYGVARGVVANRYRSHARQTRLLGRLGGLVPGERLRPVEEPDEVIVRKEDDRAILEALTQLRSFDREVLMLAAWEGLSSPRIAQVLGITGDAAEQRLRRAKRRLAQVLMTSASRVSSYHVTGGGTP